MSDQQPTDTDIVEALDAPANMTEEAIEERMYLHGLNRKDLTVQQEKLALLRASGMTVAAAQRGAGYKCYKTASETLKMPKVIAAMDFFRDQMAEAVLFTKESAHGMYMQAWTASGNSTEMKNVVDSLVKLHGLGNEQPKTQVNIQINGVKQLEKMSDAELIKLAGYETDHLEPSNGET